MATLSKTGYFGSTSYGVKIECSSTPDTSTNTSVVTVKVYLVHPYMNISGRTGSVTIDGMAYSFKTGDIKRENAGLVATKSKTVTHDDDGTREVGVAASFPYDLNSSSAGRVRTAKVSGTMTLDKIPRSSEIISIPAGITLGNGGGSFRLAVSKHADAFRHKLTLAFGTLSDTSEVFNESIDMSISPKWLEQIPNQRQGTATVSVQTYSDESCTVPIADPVTATFEVITADSVQLDLGNMAVAIAPDNSGTVAANSNLYLQGYSRIKVTYDKDTVKPACGAGFASLRIEHGGIRYEGKDGVALTDVVTTSGSNYVDVIVTDTRGIEAGLKLRPVTVQQYFLPTLSDISIYRCNGDGVAEDEGTNIYFKATCNFAPCGGSNEVHMTAAYKLVRDPNYANETDIDSGEGYVKGEGAVANTKTYNARIRAVDTIGNEAVYSVVISTALADFNLLEGGGGGAFGKYAEERDLLDCAWRFRARGGIYGSTIYTDAETEHGVHGDNAVYQRMLTGQVTANAATKIGTVADFGALLYAYGAVANTTIQTISVDSGGNVYVTSPVGGTAQVIIVYTKEVLL